MKPDEQPVPRACLVVLAVAIEAMRPQHDAADGVAGSPFAHGPGHGGTGHQAHPAMGLGHAGLNDDGLLGPAHRGPTEQVALRAAIHPMVPPRPVVVSL